ncbi:hypothetical protein DW228_06710 [Bacteroides fragilis]|uniref:Uncharacterized protein n=1 Tax=Bacteroides fragilis TaxID=817 RepID=A0A396C1U8_BACFG|nr:hypothetical protein [Bacteroides fragilis]RHH14485.1 hypothetical protein DW228_06710 [Bacteroides fragilis]
MNTPNNKITQIRKLANRDFRINRPYGIRLDQRKRTIALFNREFNVLGLADKGIIETLPVEPYRDIEDIPHSLAHHISLNGDKIDLYFYDDNTCPFSENGINEQLLLAYNKKMVILSGLLDRRL